MAQLVATAFSDVPSILDIFPPLLGSPAGESYTPSRPGTALAIK